MRYIFLELCMNHNSEVVHLLGDFDCTLPPYLIMVNCSNSTFMLFTESEKRDTRQLETALSTQILGIIHKN